MDWLTSEDWRDIGSVFGMAAAFMTALTIWRSFKQWKSRQAFFQVETFIDDLLNVLWIVPMVALLVLTDLLERHGVTGTYSWNAYCAVFLVFVAPVVYFGNRGRNHLQGKARANPNAAGTPTVAPSSEEVEVNLKANLIIIGFGIATIGPILALAYFASPLDLSSIPYVAFYALAILAALTYAIVGRWYGTVKLKSAVIEIKASPEQIWNEARFRNTTNWWKKIVSRVEQIDQSGTKFKMHYYNNDTCLDCGLPRDPDSEGRSNLVEILEAVEHERMTWRAYPKGTGGSMETMMAHEDCTYRFEASANGHTRLTCTGSVTKPRVFLAGIVLLGDPYGQELASLKAHVEGTAVDTIFDVGAARIEEARHAEKFCGCAKGAPVAGLFR
jgi:hypothetical protein